MKKIPLTKGKFAIVDDADHAEISKYKWHFSSMGYAERSVYISKGKYRREAMHRVIAGAKAGEIVDHVNMDRLDNRRANLRVGTKSQNGANRRTNSNKAVKFKGVYTHQKCKDYYEARIIVNGKSIYLGSFNTPEEAARVYNAAAKEHFGEFARLNAV